jgi:hypothetical protein
MAKFQKFNPAEQLHGLAGAARQIAREERESQNNDKDVEFNFGANVKLEGPKKQR